MSIFQYKRKIWVLQFIIQNVLVLDILHSFFLLILRKQIDKDSYICSCNNHFIKYQNSSSYKVSKEVWKVINLSKVSSIYLSKLTKHACRFSFHCCKMSAEATNLKISYLFQKQKEKSFPKFQAQIIVSK